MLFKTKEKLDDLTAQQIYELARRLLRNNDPSPWREVAAMMMQRLSPTTTSYEFKPGAASSLQDLICGTIIEFVASDEMAITYAEIIKKVAAYRPDAKERSIINTLSMIMRGVKHRFSNQLEIYIRPSTNGRKAIRKLTKAVDISFQELKIAISETE